MTDASDVDQAIFRWLLSIWTIGHRLKLGMTQHTRAVNGLTLEQTMALCAIQLSGGQLSLGELAAQLGRTPQTVSTMVRRLEALQLVQRSRDQAGDLRRVFVRISPRGEESVFGFRRAIPSVLPRLFPAPNPVDFARLHEAARLLSEFLEP